MPGRTRQEIEEILADDILAARARLEKAKGEREAVASGATGPPDDDQARRIQQLTEEQGEALHGMLGPLERFNGFMRTGEIPEGLDGEG